jgi:4-amino-4-deoxy-L-arabinose transferase-like glycosyltransferase
MNNRFPGVFPGWTWWLLILSSVAYLYANLHVLRDYGDEGLILYGAELVSEGVLPYRGFFEVFGPGSFYWLGFFFKLFGVQLATARILLLFTGVATALLTFWMTRRIHRGPFELVPAVFLLFISIPIWPASSHHWDSNLFALLSLAMFLLWTDTDNTFYLSMTGIFSGLTYCFLQQKGFLLLVSFIVSLLIINRLKQPRLKIISHAVLLIGSYFAVISLVAIYFYFNDGLADLIHATILWPLNYYKQVNVVPYGFGLYKFIWQYFHNSLSPLPPGVSTSLSGVLVFSYVLISILPFLVLFICLLCVNNLSLRSRMFNLDTVPYWIVGFGLWISEAHRPDIYHLVWGSTVLFILLYLLLNVLLKNRKTIIAVTFGVIIICSFTLGIFNLLKSSTASERTISRRGTFYSFGRDDALAFLHKEVRAGEYVFIYPYGPMYYFLANVKNPTRYNNLIYTYHTKLQFKEAIDALEKKKVRYVLWDTVVEGANLTRWFPHYKHPKEESLLMERYITERYRLIDIRNGFRIMERKDA